MLLTCIILALLLFIELAFSILAPGFFRVKRLLLDPDEKGACSVPATCFPLYLFSFLVLILRLPVACHFRFPLGGALLAWRFRDDLREYFSLPEVKRLFLCFVALLIWTGTLLALVPNYAGSGWTGDWFEHYQRAFFSWPRTPRQSRKSHPSILTRTKRSLCGLGVLRLILFSQCPLR